MPAQHDENTRSSPDFDVDHTRADETPEGAQDPEPSYPLHTASDWLHRSAPRASPPGRDHAPPTTAPVVPHKPLTQFQRDLQPPTTMLDSKDELASECAGVHLVDRLRELEADNHTKDLQLQTVQVRNAWGVGLRGGWAQTSNADFEL